MQLQKVETWFDPLDMFRQIAPNGIVNKKIVGSEGMTTPESVEKEDAGAIDHKEKPVDKAPGNAVASAEGSEDTKRTHEEMSTIGASECPFLMNKE